MNRKKGKTWHSGTKVEHLGGTRVRFTCPVGHRMTVDYGKGPVTKRMGVWGVTRMVRWWQDRVTHQCPKC